MSIWVVVTGIGAALGSLAALGHPLTILASFVAAPFTTLHPLIAAGWVAGLVQAWVKKPTVSDLEELPTSVMSVKGFWLNPVSRILLVVIFAFGGVEIVAVAAAETADPERSIRKAVNTILWRILIFYMGAVTIMLLALPWNDPSLKDAPFVAVLNAAGLPAVAAMIGTVVVVALLSSLNANLYGGSRMIFSLAERRMGPAVMRGTNARGVPVAAVLATSFLGFVAAALNYFWAEEVLKFLLNMVGSTMIVIWLGIIASHLALHRRAAREGNHSLKGFPVALSWATLVAVVAVVALGFTVPEIAVQLSSTFALTALLAAVGGWLAKRAAVPGPESEPAAENGM